MSTYTPNYSDVGGWKDDEAGGTPATADTLNHIETGIVTAHEEIEDLARLMVSIVREYPKDTINIPLGGNLKFALDIVGGTAPFTYQWVMGDGTTYTSGSVVHRYQTENSYTITVTVTDATGKTASASITLAVTDHAMLFQGLNTPIKSMNPLSRTRTTNSHYVQNMNRSQARVMNSHYVQNMNSNQYRVMNDERVTSIRCTRAFSVINA